MLHQLFNFPRTQHFYLACSGGSDSMAVANFYYRGGKNFTLAYFNHGTVQADEMEQFVLTWGKEHNVPVKIGKIKDTNHKKYSPEEFLRNCRYDWFNELGDNDPIVTCHHLNDVVETWIFTSLHGNAKLILPQRGRFYRPFLTTTKQQLLDWCLSHNVKWVEDRSNTDVSVPRNRIRHTLMSEALKINPGLFKVIKKKVLNLI